MKRLNQTQAQLAVKSLGINDTFHTVLSTLSTVYKAKITSVLYQKVHTGVVQHAVHLFDDDSKLKVTKFIPLDGKARLTLNTNVKD
jgi:hypothetical protein